MDKDIATLPNWVLEGRKLRERATHGPWEAETNSVYMPDDSFVMAHEKNQENNAAFIAAAPEYQERLEKALEIAIATLSAVNNHGCCVMGGGYECSCTANDAIMAIERMGEK